MKPQHFAKVLAVVAMVTALAGVASAASMIRGTTTRPAKMPTSTTTMTKGTMTGTATMPTSTTTMTTGTMTRPATAPVMQPMK